MYNAYPNKNNPKVPKAKWVPKTIYGAVCSFMSLNARTCKGCWNVGSGCSRHMTAYFTSLTKIDSGSVTFVNNRKGKICDEGKIRNSSLYIKNVLSIEALKNNLLIKNQLYDNRP